MKLIETYEHDAPDYNPFLIGPRWQVAMINYTDFETVGKIERLDIHYHTDEAFVLLEGHSALIGAEIVDDKITYEVTDLQPNKVYNIPKGVWHRMTMQPGSKVLIIEDSDTHLGDFAFYYLSDEQKKQLKEAVAKVIG